MRSSIIGCFSQVQSMLLCPALVPPPQSGLDWQLLGDFYKNISFHVIDHFGSHDIIFWHALHACLVSHAEKRRASLPDTQLVVHSFLLAHSSLVHVVRMTFRKLCIISATMHGDGMEFHVEKQSLPPSLLHLIFSISCKYLFVLESCKAHLRLYRIA